MHVLPPFLLWFCCFLTLLLRNLGIRLKMEHIQILTSFWRHFTWKKHFPARWQPLWLQMKFAVVDGNYCWWWCVGTRGTQWSLWWRLISSTTFQRSPWGLVAQRLDNPEVMQQKGQVSQQSLGYLKFESIWLSFWANSMVCVLSCSLYFWFGLSTMLAY